MSHCEAEHPPLDATGQQLTRPSVARDLAPTPATNIPCCDEQPARPEIQAQSLRGQSFVQVVNGELADVLTFHVDGAVSCEMQQWKEGRWSLEFLNGRTTLILVSATGPLRRFSDGGDGVWESLDSAAEEQLIAKESRPRDLIVNEQDAQREAAEFIRRMPPWPCGAYDGRGIVICGGGTKYFPSAWVCIRTLRHLGCPLPIELWHLGTREMDQVMRDLVNEYDVTCIDASAMRGRYPVRILRGWELKPYAILHSRFAEVLLLDADNVPVLDPQFLFDTPQYKSTGAIFWPDIGRLGPLRSIWRICGVAYRDEPEFESGQIAVGKARCWRALQLTMHLNEHSDFYYQHVHGDKETFHMAWRMLGQKYAMPPFPVRMLPGTMCQHDFAGRRIFQHRNMLKWSVGGADQHVAGFEHEEQCFRFLSELRQRWDGVVHDH